jgi:hypothetical protein
LRSNIEIFIEAYYNRCRLHSALAYQPPEEFEQQLDSTTINAGATMSFFSHGETIDPMVHWQKQSAARRPLPFRLSVSMSLQLGIPWRVALQQSSPPLHQPPEILNQSAGLRTKFI